MPAPAWMNNVIDLNSRRPKPDGQQRSFANRVEALVERLASFNASDHRYNMSKKTASDKKQAQKKRNKKARDEALGHGAKSARQKSRQNVSRPLRIRRHPTRSTSSRSMRSRLAFAAKLTRKN